MSGNIANSTPSHSGGPPTSKTLVLCFDGTGDQFDSDNSNVVKVFNLLERNNLEKQMVYYQPGIGTYTSPQLDTFVGRAVSMILDKMVAWNLDAHVISGYEFLMQHYKDGDKIRLFGFSRGAYTARALAGMLHKVGLLPPGNHQQVPFAYKMYKHGAKAESKGFKEHFSLHVIVDFVGVWDTVSSVGLIHRKLPFTNSRAASIRVFRHAVSLDERRAKFKVYYYYSREGKKRKSSEGEGETDVKEVWFAGCHCDVGGGAVKNTEENSLAHISLRWMIGEAHNSVKSAICFRKGSEGVPVDPILERKDQDDAKCQIHDQLSIKPWWWILEVLPSKRYEKKEWWKDISLNLGRGRTMPSGSGSVLLHRSVKLRQEELKTYKWKAKRGKSQPEPTYVDTKKLPL